LQGDKGDVPSLLRDAKTILEHLQSLEDELLEGSFKVEPSTIENLDTMAEATKTELEGDRNPGFFCGS